MGIKGKRLCTVFLVWMLLLSVVAVLPAPTVQAEEYPLLAFPGAMGYGAFATGGRGGEVRKVTNLNDSGTGSFRAAVLGDAPKIVVFEVSGIIRLLSNMDVGKNTTIAGQTSPAGITFYNFDAADPQESDANGRIELNDNTIIRHIRIRGSRFGDSPIEALGRTHHVILDHVSLAWGGDDNLSFTTFGEEGAQYITVQWSTIEEPLEGWHEHPSERAHNYGMKLTGKANGNISVFYNLLTHVKRRNPSMDFGMAGMVGDIRNNVYYNSGAAFKVTQGSVDETAAEAGSYNYMNNYFKHGEDSGIMGYSADNVELETVIKPISLYMSGNYDNEYSGHYPPTNELLHYALDPDVTLLTEPVAVAAPYPDSTAAQAYGYVVEQAGAWPRDDTTERVIADVVNGTGSMVSISPDTIPNATVRAYYSEWQGDLDQNDFPNSAAPLDSDQDGMPDNWEDAKGLNKNAADHNGTNLSAAGYRNIEVYINEKADALLPAPPPSPVIPPLTPTIPSDTDPPLPPPTSGLVSNLVVGDLANASDYDWIGQLQVGDTRYGDRTTTVVSLPSSLAGSDWIRTANDSKAYTGNTLTFTLTGSADIYIAHDDRVNSKPAWLSDWTDIGDDLIDSSGGVFSLFKKSFASGATVSLGTNSGGIVDSAMYTVIITPADGLPPSDDDLVLEGENQTWSASDGTSLFNKSGASGGQYVRVNADAAGDYGEFSTEIAPGAYTLTVGYVTSSKGGQFQLNVGGSVYGSPIDTYAATEGPAEAELGELTLSGGGAQTFRFDITGKNSSATDFDARIDYVKLDPVDAPAAPVIVFSDDFEDGNSTGWAGLGGTWSVEDDGSYVYRQSQSTGHFRAETGDLAWTDQIVEAKVRPLQFDGANTLAGIRGRYSDPSSYYQLALKSSGTLELSKRVNNVATVLATAPYGVNADEWYTLKLEMIGNEVKGYANGDLLLSTSDSSLAAGKISLFVYRMSADFDDVSVAEPAVASGLSISGPVLTNAEDEPVGQLTASSDLIAHVTVANDTEQSEDVIFVVALYNAYGVVMNVSYAGGTVSANGPLSFSAGFRLPSNVTGYYVKSVLWDSIVTKGPLSNAMLFQ
jgi:hypothetical protein